MKPIELTSKENPVLKTVRMISTAARRAPADLVIAEGLHGVEESFLSGHAVETILVSESFGSSEKQQTALEQWSSSHTRVYRLPARLFDRLSGVQAPQGVLALVRVPPYTLEKVDVGANALVVCACEIQDPGNLGTLIRTAAAAGADLFCTTQGTVSARNVKALRSTAGSFFHLPIVEHLSCAELIQYCRTRKLDVYTTDAASGTPYFRCDFRKGSAIFLGNEGAGLAAPELRSLPSIRVPMAERRVESLNVATAGAIILFEALRQRSPSGGKE